MGNGFKDMTGSRFGRLTAISQAGVDNQRNALWLCRCDCGNEIVTRGSSLRAGCSRSCGCLRIDSATTHNMCKTRLWKEWYDMRSRCRDKKRKIYGARGISVCEDWENSFETFCDWALANGYQDSLTLDRIDPDGAYCPENCRWVTMKAQENNKRNNIRLTYEGETHTVTEWAEIKGINRMTVYARIRRGWPPERLFEPPIA